jgi:hypothetical protein
VSRTSIIIALYEAPGMPACRTHDHSQPTTEGQLDLRQVFASVDA